MVDSVAQRSVSYHFRPADHTARTLSRACQSPLRKLTRCKGRAHEDKSGLTATGSRSPMRLQVLVKFLRSLFQVMKCQMQIAVGFQGENDEVSRLQRLDNDVQILVAAADPCGCLS